jgi:hypothetical protein
MGALTAASAAALPLLIVVPLSALAYLAALFLLRELTAADARYFVSLLRSTVPDGAAAKP